MAKDRMPPTGGSSTPTAGDTRAYDLARDLFVSIVAASWPNQPAGRDPRFTASACLELAAEFIAAADNRTQSERMA